MKKLFKVTFVAAFAAIAGYGVYANQKSDAMSDLALANVEALADSREGSLCPNGCVDNGNGCACNGTWNPVWEEYKW